jgi:uncharacterized protein YjiS (DUF1127 family)
MTAFRSALTHEVDASSPSELTLLDRVAGWWRRRLALDELRHLSDAQLSDIGIDRQDLGMMIERDLHRFRNWCW